MDIYGIVFKENGKVYDFLSDGTKFEKNDYVIVETEKGIQLGKVFSLKQTIGKEKDFKTIVRKATTEDYDSYLNNLTASKECLNIAKIEAEKLKLPMNIIDCNYTLDRKRLSFNFISDGRVDFRELVKVLAAKFKTRIELYQIGVRDKAREIGGLGQCGNQLCCTKFLNNMGTISINMAKNQNIALNPSKINGACGRLLCCLAYEDDLYVENKSNMPNFSDEVVIDGVKGKVISVDVLNRRYKVYINDEVREIKVD